MRRGLRWVVVVAVAAALLAPVPTYADPPAATGILAGDLMTNFGVPPQTGQINAGGEHGDFVAYAPSDGHYSLVLPPGHYRVYLEGRDTQDPTADYQTYWWEFPDEGGQSSYDVEVTAGQTTTLDGYLTYHLLSDNQPRIWWADSSAPGGVLHAEVGHWTGAGTTLACSWWRDGTTEVGTGTTYVMQRADAGHKVYLRVDAAQDWHGHHYTASIEDVSAPGLGDPEQVVVTALPSAVTVTGHQHGRHGLVLSFGVTSAGPPVDGFATVAERHHLWTVDVIGGHGVLRLGDQHVGRHRFTVAYAGSPTVAPSATTTTVRVSRRPRS